MASMIRLENAHVINAFRNFSGKETQFNPEGNRNFCVIIDNSEYADALAREGWNIRHTKPRNEDEEPTAYLQVKVSYKNYAPDVKMVSGNTITKLDESTIDILDWADIDYVDIRISPSNWSYGGRSGVAAYLHEMYVVVSEDDFDRKYAGYEVRE